MTVLNNPGQQRGAVKQQTVLLVDDEQGVLNSYRQILAPERESYRLDDLLGLVEEQEERVVEQHRFRVIESQDGETALEMHLQACAAGTPPAVALVDMRMPMGMETALRLRQQDANIHIIIISAYSDVDNETIQLALQHDFQFMNKPISADELYHVVCSAADSYELGRQHQLREGLSAERFAVDESVRERVLLVDDDPMALRLTSATLRKYLKVEVLIAESGAEALRLVEEERPNLIMLDIHMPKMDGLSLCRRLKSSQRTKDIPVLFLTADSTDKTVLEGFKAGAVDYVNKPFSSPVLIARVLAHMNLYRKSRRQEMLSNTDPLTGLPNRTAFHAVLQMQVSEHGGVVESGRGRGAVESGHFTLLFVDLDRFKQVNDEMGHEMVDQLLQAVAERLKKSVREDDLVARLGGDEFVVMLLGTLSAEAVAKVAGKIVSRMGEPFRLDSGMAQIGSSIGSARFPQDAEDGEELLRHADMAMYQAKSKGRSCHVPFSRSMQADQERRLQLLGELRQAIGEEQLALKFQPRVDLHSGRIVGLDSALYWNHPQQGEWRVEQFQELLLEGELGADAERLILKQACRQIRHFDQYRGSAVEVNIALSEDRFRQDDLDHNIAGMVEEAGMPAALIGQLGVDVHESLLIESPEVIQQRLQRLKALGLRLYLDQFGSGCVSISCLNRLPLDGIKLPRELVQQIGDPEAELVLKMMASIAGLIEVPLIAVGVENGQQVQFLTAIGCQQGAGPHFYPPLEVQRLNEVMAQR
jgi:diguanylate cyclase (GGDEF)-like protein